MKENGSSPRKAVSIICPVFNEEKCVPLFYERMRRVIDSLSGRYDFELIFANNRSSDGTLAQLTELRRKDSEIQILTLSRNFGYQASVQAGLSHASGDAIVVIDADCEDPPELLGEFIAKWQEGYDVVYGIRKDRDENWVVKNLRNLFYRLLRFSADMDIVLYMAEFALISSVVRDAIINNQNTFPFLRAEIGYVGFSRFGVEYRRQRRAAGQTHYNFFRMVAFGAAGLLTSSTFLLRLAVYAFPLLVLFNAAALLLGFFQTLVAVDLLYLAFLLTTQGVYLARIYKNGMGRPLFVLDPRDTHVSPAAAARERRTAHYETA